MKAIVSQGKYLLPLLLLAAPLMAKADQLVPAGSVISCTVSEPKISSQTDKVGDPVMCQLGHTELYGRTSFPYGSYLIGHFAAYKDPGHFVGKGYMELDFDRLIVQPDTNVPINARVVSTPGYKVDQDGHILGNGHATKDTVMWLIPVLWPIDLINLPRRGPRPVLKAETKLTLKVMDDFGIPTPMENAVRTPALVSRQTTDEPNYQDYQRPAPVQRAYAQDPAPVQQQPAYQQPTYQQPSYQAPVQNFYIQPPAQQQAPQVQYVQPQVQYVQPQVQYVQPQTVVVQSPPVYNYPPPPPPVYYYPRRYYPGY